MSIRLSGKTLAELAMPGVCPDCFRIKIKLEQLTSIGGKRLPFQMPMPGVFSNLDSHTKQVIKDYFEKNKKMPSWFPDLGVEIAAIENAPGWQNFNAYFPEHDVKLTGALDVVFKLSDGSYALGDYKTARFSDTHDTLLPLYKAQLHSYMEIAKKLGIFQPVSKLFLVYTEPVGYKPEEALYSIADFDDKFKLDFNVIAKTFEIEPNLTNNLLTKAKLMIAGEELDHLEYCPNCVLRERLHIEENAVATPVEKKVSRLV